jgi:hypothetical protein
VELHRLAPPQQDLAFGEDRPRCHADREGPFRKIERATGVERARGKGAVDMHPDLTLRNVDEAVRPVGARSPKESRQGDCFVAWREQKPFIGSERDRGVAPSGICGTRPERQRHAERGAGVGRRLAIAAQD